MDTPAGTSSCDLVDSDDIEITVADEMDFLRSLAESHNHSFSSPIVDEISGKLSVMARRHTREEDRAFFGALRRLVKNDGFSLRTMPKAVVAIQKMLGAPEVHIARLSAQLRLEPSVATRVVSIANCTLFGGQGRVASVDDAIVRLGLIETRNIVMAITAKSRLFRLPGRQERADELYQHALASAVAGKIVAERNNLVAGEEAFIACLLSELGRIVIYSAAADLVRESRGATTPHDETLEKTVSDLHGPVSALIAESWQFDLDTVSAIHFHHRPSSAPPEVRIMSQLMYAADDLAMRAVQQVSGQDMSLGLLSARKALGVEGEIDMLVEQTKIGYEELIRVITDPEAGEPPVRGKAV